MNENPEKIVVDSDLIPEVLLKVIEAKKLLSQGKAKNSSEAARMAGIPYKELSGNIAIKIGGRGTYYCPNCQK